MDYEKKYKEALERARIWKDKSGMPKNKQGILDEIFPELAESEDERMIREIKRYIKEQGDKPSGLPNGTAAVDDMLSWFEKQGKSSDQIHYWTEEEIEPIISDYLRGAEHYGGMIGRLRCLKPKSLERQGESLNMDIDIESMTEAYKQRLINQCNGVRNSPLVNMCITSFRHGIENTLDAMKLKGLKKQKIIDVQSLRIGLLRDIAMSLVIFLDENTLGMDMSSMECEDIESAVINSDWLKIYAYMKKKLEKQGEKPQGKSALEAAKEEKVDNQYCAKPIDKVKPIFSIGDVLCDKSCTTLNKEAQPNLEIVDIRNGLYICDKCSFPISHQDEYELVAKRIEPQPAWSEEDEKMLNGIIDEIEANRSDAPSYDIPVYEGYLNWLKSLKERVQPQPKKVGEK